MSWDIPVHVTSFNSTLLRSTSISFHLHLRLPRGPVSSDFPTKSLRAFVISVTPAICQVRMNRFDFVSLILRGGGGRHKTSHRHSQSRPNWVEATYKLMAWNSPTLTDAREISIVRHEHDVLRAQRGVGFTTYNSHKWLTLKWNTSLLRLFLGERRVLQSQGSHHGRRYDTWFVCVCICVYACVWNIVHELNLFDVGYKNSEADWKTNNLFNFQNCVSNAWAKVPVHMHPSHRICTCRSMIYCFYFLRSVSDTPSHNMITMDNYYRV
jgi:hypothetical protein